MQNAEWITLFRQMPLETHCKLVLVLQNRTDISIDTVFRLEPSFVVIRGRLGGTTETGLMFMVPYDQITSIYLNREIKEEEINTIFAAPPAAVAPPPAKFVSHQGGRPAANGAAPAAVTLRPSINGSAKPGDPPATAARNNLLERLRAARNAAMPMGANGKP